ncbi:MAG: J domain-containing protein [Alphaproteobacteria bacterium]|nr:J domain-containing protein [Alphaproteobacteria bacterium]
MPDPYRVLGLAEGASDAEIKGAFRRLAKRFHPDLNRGDPAIGERFRELSLAYDQLLAAAARRQRRDRAEAPRRNPAPPLWPDPEFDKTLRYSRNGSRGQDEPQSVPAWATEWGMGQARSENAPDAGGGTMFASLRVSFIEAATGAVKSLTLPDGRTIELVVPPGTVNGQTLMVGARGGGDPASSTILEIQVDPHPEFRREGMDIHLDLPISLPEAVLGGTVRVPTVHGAIAIAIPAGANSGTVLRLAGRGVRDQASGRQGDQLLRLTIMLPERLDPNLARFLETWARHNSYDPRNRPGPTGR